LKSSSAIITILNKIGRNTQYEKNAQPSKDGYIAIKRLKAITSLLGGIQSSKSIITFSTNLKIWQTEAGKASRRGRAA
jgi:hypothetical protein